MSPVRACARHGTPNCPLCRARRRKASPRRPYSDTAAYRAMLVEVLETHGDVCPYCGEPVTDDNLELAHVIAHADGGTFTLDNLRAAHRSPCNRAAGRRPITQEQDHG